MNISPKTEKSNNDRSVERKEAKAENDVFMSLVEAYERGKEKYRARYGEHDVWGIDSDMQKEQGEKTLGSASDYVTRLFLFANDSSIEVMLNDHNERSFYL